MTTMDDLAAFISARLDEDEAMAEGAARTDDGHHGRWLPVHFGAAGFDARVDDHIARHDPARELRAVDAKRRTLDRHRACGTGVGYCDDGGKGWEGDDGKPLCNDKLDLAAPYSDHPGYRPEWAPGHEESR